MWTVFIWFETSFEKYECLDSKFNFLTLNMQNKQSRYYSIWVSL